MLDCEGEMSRKCDVCKKECGSHFKNQEYPYIVCWECNEEYLSKLVCDICGKKGLDNYFEQKKFPYIRCEDCKYLTKRRDGPYTCDICGHGCFSHYKSDRFPYTTCTDCEDI